ncbi:MAG TPA: glycerol-3-phosphate dehydrogenase C-terminal domain-containing protein, partial [Chloroflexia bacterium]|nr:glycerol-3-phosphate dehydrogenase C-terminal domain-containing protein [Chloroflexia bacterium]
VYACRYEMALTLEDVLARRTRIAIEDWHQGARCALDVATRMAAELGWDAAELARQVGVYLASVAGWRETLAAAGATPAVPVVAAGAA